jgi:hypothetical protein
VAREIKVRISGRAYPLCAHWRAYWRGRLLGHLSEVDLSTNVRFAIGWNAQLRADFVAKVENRTTPKISRK